MREAKEPAENDIRQPVLLSEAPRKASQGAPLQSGTLNRPWILDTEFRRQEDILAHKEPLAVKGSSESPA